MNDKNAQMATTAYQRIFGDHDLTAIDEFMTPNFIQHNPTIADGPEGVKALIQMLVAQGVPKQKIMFKHVMANDDTIILHSRYEMAGNEWRFIDIYRIEDGKLAEHWDGMMQMPEQRANTNPLF
jgi:predicted SnoaL-like aldol condensation-catalyzing enzyme